MEVKLGYPKMFHDSYNAYPLTAKKNSVEKEWMLDYQIGLLDKLGQKFTGEKLMLKERYVLHDKNLQQYFSLGIKLKKVHRAITFEQECWICHEAIHEKKNNNKTKQTQTKKRNEARIIRNYALREQCFSLLRSMH